MNFNISNEELVAINEGQNADLPKYTSQLINLANQNAQGTRPRVVGQLSELFPNYQSQSANVSIVDWKNWYTQQYPDAIKNATDKIFKQVENLKTAISQIDKEMVTRWVEDLVISKTYHGLYVQKAILVKLAEKKGLAYRLSTPAEESLGIDGYVGETAYSIKPDTYKTMTRLHEKIAVKMIYYTKTKTGFKIEVEE
jgi:hypothetical protein